MTVCTGVCTGVCTVFGDVGYIMTITVRSILVDSWPKNKTSELLNACTPIIGQTVSPVRPRGDCLHEYFPLVPRLLPSFLSHTVCDKSWGGSLGKRLYFCTCKADEEASGCIHTIGSCN